MAAQLLHKHNLVNAHILLRCGEPQHKKMCGELRDVLLQEFNNVEEAYTAESIYGADDFCVAATAKIDPKNAKEFEAALWKLQVNSKPTSKVKDVRVDVEIAFNR